MEGVIVIVVFFGSIAGLVTLGVELNLVQKWGSERFGDGPGTKKQLVAMDERISELEERIDFAKRALTDLKSRERLGPPQQ